MMNVAVVDDVVDTIVGDDVVVVVVDAVVVVQVAGLVEPQQRHQTGHEQW